MLEAGERVPVEDLSGVAEARNQENQINHAVIQDFYLKAQVEREGS